MIRNAVPMVELHCHLDGILSPAMARRIRKRRPDFPVDPDELARAYPVTDFDSFWSWYGRIRPLDGRLDLYHPILEDHVASLKEQGVLYAEIMIAAGEVPEDPIQAVDEVTAFRGLADTLEEGRIQVEFLVAFGRNKPATILEKIERKIQALHRAGLIVGVALAGPEQGHPVAPLRPLLERFHGEGLSIEVHGGEWSGPESVHDALDHGYPDRIGHGTSLFQDPDLIATFRERALHVEMCPTSNLKTGSIARIEDHPVGRAWELGLDFSVNTDDPGIFECSMASEFRLLQEVFGLGEHDRLRIAERSLAARFEPILRHENARALEGSL